MVVCSAKSQILYEKFLKGATAIRRNQSASWLLLKLKRRTEGALIQKMQVKAGPILHQLSFQSPSRTAMAAAAWSRSRGVAGVRATTGLFSIFTLLCLVCLSSSLIHKDQLKELKENLQKAQEQLDEAKAMYEPEMGTAKQLVGLSVSLMDSLETFMKADEEEFPDDSLHVQGFVQGVKDFVKSNKNTIDKKDEEMRAQLEKSEKKLERLRKLITLLEEQQFEL